MPTNAMKKYVRDNANFLTSAIGDETVVMNMQNGNYIGLNTVASDIWVLLENPVSIDGIVKKLVSMYDVSEEECQKQSQDCINKLLEQNMIQEQ